MARFLGVRKTKTTGENYWRIHCPGQSVDENCQYTLCQRPAPMYRGTYQLGLQVVIRNADRLSRHYNIGPQLESPVSTLVFGLYYNQVQPRWSRCPCLFPFLLTGTATRPKLGWRSFFFALFSFCFPFFISSTPPYPTRPYPTPPYLTLPYPAITTRWRSYM